MKTSSKTWQKIRKIKGLRQFVTWYPRHVFENPGFNAHCEFGVIFIPSSALLQSMRRSILSKVVISILLQYWFYVAYISFIAFRPFVFITDKPVVLVNSCVFENYPVEHDTQGSFLVNKAFTALEIGNRVGHESEKITYRYAHLFPTKQDDMANFLDNERGIVSDRKEG